MLRVFSVHIQTLISQSIFKACCYKLFELDIDEHYIRVTSYLESNFSPILESFDSYFGNEFIFLIHKFVSLGNSKIWVITKPL